VGLPAPAQQSLAGLAADVERLPAEARAAVARALSELIGDDAPSYRLTRSQVRALAQAGFEIGFHTRDHRPLPELTDDELVLALDEGRAALEAAAGRPLRTIAYPHGRADERVAAAARAAGYTDGFGGLGRSITARSGRMLLDRIELLLEDPSSFELAVASELWKARQPVRPAAAEVERAASAAEADGAER
jgi:peptidoglycan/xylan/chitin deacetylase (PgdA/CDA1 family)